jgi:perosamine synthetase
LKEFDLIVAVDVGGLPVDYDRLMSLGKIVLADSAESMGSTYKGCLIGTQAHIHTFSLHRSKIISSGEGGLITTQDKDLADIVRSFINHGYDLNKRSWEYKHDTFGLNCRISNVNAALAFSQLSRLHDYVEHRNKLADLYKTRLTGRGFQFQQIPSHSKTNYFLFGVLVDSMFRDNLVELMNAAGVIVKTWPSLSTLDCYDRSPLEISEKIAQSIVLLPISNKTSAEEVELSCDLFLKIYEKISLSNS